MVVVESSTFCTPLPASVRETILSHLLPPNPPLPPQLLSRTFIDRLTFLPPSIAEDDSHLSPFPFSSKKSLHQTLYDLTRAQFLGPPSTSTTSNSQSSITTEYAHDGEVFIARCKLRANQQSTNLSDNPQGLDVLFELEQGEESRGWVYRGVVIADGSGGSINWVECVEDASRQISTYRQGEEGETPENYWSGFSPAKPSIEIDTQYETDIETGYWAQYGGGAETPGITGGATPFQSGSRTPHSPELAKRLNVNDNQATADALNLLVHTFQPISSSSQPSAEAALLRDKLLGQILLLLRRAWSSYSTDHEMEESAMLWLRIGREIVDRPTWEKEEINDSEMETKGVREAVMTARMEAAIQMFAVLDDGQGHRDGFFRLVEKAITIPQLPIHEESDGYDQYES